MANRESTEPERRARPSERRAAGDRRQRTSLTLEAIVTAATSILDTEGLEALTLRGLARELGVGVASMYWYVDDKDDLLEQCYHAVVDDLAHTLFDGEPDLDNWRQQLHALAAAVFDNLEPHPWVVELMTSRFGNSGFSMQLWETVGHTLVALGLDVPYAFGATSALLNQLGSAGLTAARQAYETDEKLDRDAVLDAIATSMAQLDPAEFPFITSSIPIFRVHTERDQFLGGVEVILDGIEARLARADGGRERR